MMKNIQQTEIQPAKITFRISLFIWITFTMLSLSGCASQSQRPDTEIARADRAIETAEESGAREFAGDALERARENLRRARGAVETKDFSEAQQWAIKAELDAELAISQTDRVKADQALKEVNDSINTLREEIARNRNINNNEGGK